MLSAKEAIYEIIDELPEDKLDTVLTFIKFVYSESFQLIDINNSVLSEQSLAKDWLTETEDKAWQNL